MRENWFISLPTAGEDGAPVPQAACVWPSHAADHNLRDVDDG